MKLCFVASGISIHTKKWLDWFAAHGHEVHLITPPYDEPLQEFHLEVTVHVLPYIWPVRWRGSRLLNALFWVQFTSILIHSDIRPDLVEGQYIGVPGYTARWAVATDWTRGGGHLGLLGMMSLIPYRPRRYPLVLQAWGSDILLDTKKPWYRWITKNALRRADMVLCDSDTVKQGIQGLGTDMSKVRKMCNGIDTEFFSPNLQSHDKQIVISTRSLESVYNVADTIKTAPLVLQHFPSTHYVICGDGPLKEELEELTWKLGIRDKVTFVGQCTQTEIRDWLRKATIYTSSSLSDSTSLCLLEALACELPVVVSSLDANKEWVNADNGYLVPVGDVQGAANRIKELLRSSELRGKMGRENRKIAVEQGDINDNMTKVESYYYGLMA